MLSFHGGYKQFLGGYTEAENIKINDFNNKMYEICKKSGVFDKLESINAKEIESQKWIYESSKSVDKETTGRHGKKTKNFVEKEPKSKRTEHCWFLSQEWNVRVHPSGQHVSSLLEDGIMPTPHSSNPREQNESTNFSKGPIFTA